MADRRKTLARTLQAETGWSYQACRNLLEKHAWDYDAALREARKGKALIPAAVDRLMGAHASGAALRKAGELVEWERLEREDEARADFVPSFASRWNGEVCRGKARAHAAPTAAETEAFVAWEREHLGVDRVKGTVRYG